MDTLYWTKLNPKIKLCHTTKQYFRKYTWKMTCVVPGARSILMNDDTSITIESLTRYNRLVSFGGWRSALKPVVFADIQLLETLRFIRRKMQDRIKVCIEEPNLRFYSDKESVLKEIVFHLQKFNYEFISEISGPSDADSEKLLENGVIITRTQNKFQYKIILRNQRYPQNTKQQILAYLENLGDQVSLNENGRRLLSLNFESLWGTYFYTNDINVITFLNLISPNCVSNIHRLVYRD